MLKFRLSCLALLALLAACSTPPGSTKTASEALPVSVPERLMQDLETDFSLPPQSAAAIAGNLAHESGNFRMLQEINGGCYGYSQWCGPRKRAFRSFAQTRGGQQTYEANYGYLAYELKTQYPAMIDRLRRTEDVDTAASIFMKEFLRPAPKTANLARRIRFAKRFLLSDFTGSACYSHAEMDGVHSPAPCPVIVKAAEAEAAKPAAAKN
ncbi:phage tail tip lysozyme [Poseidonocella sp. HB161398]|uniref:phage tail tip lysozyme n=1 Tax=Poseidonocella sp. HB161398 TaxID=2320855 RepID=UPI001107F458|nr:phage tail tip lysozyme [Poseidonocella sp. HB161398]